MKADIIFIAVCMCTQVMMHIKLYYDMAFLVKCILVCCGHSYLMTDMWGVGSNGAYILIMIFGDIMGYYFF